jgi:1,4-dihydroxy-2-naphthoate octaprenyltransferase
VGVASLACGLVIDLLLMINNYRDREQDKVSGKQTLVVRLGARAGEWLYLGLGWAASLLCLYFLWEGKMAAAFLPQLYVYPHFLTWRRMVEIGHGRELNLILGETSRNMLLFGVLLAIGLCL